MKRRARVIVEEIPHQIVATIESTPSSLPTIAVEHEQARVIIKNNKVKFVGKRDIFIFIKVDVYVLHPNLLFSCKL